MTGDGHRVHGLAGEDVVPTWPPLGDAELRLLLRAWPQLHGPVTILWRSPRPFSVSARVRCGSDEVFVKRHPLRVRDAATLGEEQAFIAHLRSRGLPAPEVLLAGDGRGAIEQGEFVYEIHALAAGEDCYRDCPSWTPLIDLAHAHAAGHMLARLHDAAEDFSTPPRAAWMLVARDEFLRAADPLAAIAAMTPVRPALAGFLAQRDWRGALAPIVERQQRIQPLLAQQPRLWTHNDWHASNLFWRGDELSAVLDFGLAAPTFALYDLATAIERNAIAWLQLERGAKAVHVATARALIEGYAKVRPLDDAHRHLLAELLPIVHVDFALSEIEYFHGVTASSTDAELAWHTFLLGHAAWFDGAPGRMLLEAIAATT